MFSSETEVGEIIEDQVKEKNKTNLTDPIIPGKLETQYNEEKDMGTFSLDFRMHPLLMMKMNIRIILSFNK